MGKHGTRGHKKSTAFSNSTSGGLGYTLNKELKKQVGCARARARPGAGAGAAGDGVRMNAS